MTFVYKVYQNIDQRIQVDLRVFQVELFLR